MKKIFSFLISILIFILISLLCVSFCLKEIIVNTLSKEFVRKEISSKVTSYAKELYADVDYDTLKSLETSIGNNENINKITEKYFDNIIYYITSDKDIKLPDTKKELLNLIEQNDYVLKENGIYVSNEDKEIIVNKISDSKVLDKVYKNVVTSIKNDLTSEEKVAINLYNKITTSTFRWIILSIIVIAILLLVVIKRSAYKWTYNVAVSLALAGILVALIIPFCINTISSKLTSEVLGHPIDININSLTNMGYICLALCVFFIIAYIVGNKVTKYSIKKRDY